MNDECLICKKHYTQGGDCYLEKRNCIMYENEPRGKMVRTNITLDLGFCPIPQITPRFEFGETICLTDDLGDWEVKCIKINWIDLSTREFNITAEYHENDRPNREKKKRVFWVVNGGKEKQA